MSPPSHKQEILALLDAGEYGPALQHALTWLDSSPENTDALYVSGLACLFVEQFDKSIQYLEQASKKNPDNATCIANLGIACLRSGDTGSAISYLKKAIDKQPDYELARYNLGSAYIKNQQAELAIEHFRILTENHPDSAEYLCALADATRETGQWLQSIKLYKKTLAIDTDHSRAHTNMGPLMMHLGQLDDAVEHCLRAIELGPDQTLPRKNLGDCYVQMEQLDEAMDAYADAYQIDSNNAELDVAIGNVWLETADHAEASSWFHKAHLLDEDNIPALCGLAHIEREAGNLQLALDILQPLLKKDPENTEVLLNLSDTLWDDGDAEAALLHLNTVLKLQPQRTAIYAKTGHILSSAGDIKGALEQYRTALAQNPHCIPALNGLATTQRDKLENRYFNTLQELLNPKTRNQQLKPGVLAALHNALAFYFDGNRQFEAAASHMQQANHFQWQHKKTRGWKYDIQTHEDHVTKLIDTFTHDYFERIKTFGSTDNTPVFIVAMPRSGTTLTEQILARHENVLGIGERNFASQSLNQFAGVNNAINLDQLNDITQSAIERLSLNYLSRLKILSKQSNKTGITRVVDKMPDNYSLIGWILTLFPNAKIIHLKRDPADVALSCWMTQFGSIRWACHKEHISHRLQQYQRIMQHWRDVIPDRFIETSYEQLVKHQSDESARLIEYIGLDWDEDCLKFYESDRLIRTASITQVRQPIYKKSVCRWKAYQPYISDLFNVKKTS
ncbi:MAG TPA: sulfotransferase family protein [Gammaproteobacteria bacterium]|nr:sulfotransferase family protein [Gammaproteobacteria bacterium]